MALFVSQQTKNEIHALRKMAEESGDRALAAAKKAEKETDALLTESQAFREKSQKPKVTLSPVQPSASAPSSSTDTDTTPISTMIKAATGCRGSQGQLLVKCLFKAFSDALAVAASQEAKVADKKELPSNSRFR